MAHIIQQDITNLLHNSVVLLALVQRIAQARVHCDDLVHVPEHLRDKVGFAVFRDEVLLLDALDPDLHRQKNEEDGVER